MAIKNAIYQVDNGVDFDEIHFKTSGSQVVLEDTGNNFTATNLEAAMAELFQNVSNGKSSVATAITGKGVAAAGSDAFAILATKIGQISTGKKWASGTATKYTSAIDGNSYITFSNLSFVPTIVIGYNQAITSGSLVVTIALAKSMLSSGLYSIAMPISFTSSSYSFNSVVSLRDNASYSGYLTQAKVEIPIANYNSITAYNWIAFE